MAITSPKGPPRLGRNAAAKRALLSLLLAVNCFASVDKVIAGAAAKRADVTWAVQLAENYAAPLVHNVTYFTANNFEAKLDVHVPTGNDRPRPTLMYIHGGGWMGGYSKEGTPFAFLPFLQLGWIVVNVDYRPSSVSPAPAAVEDCLCALRWVGRNAKQYNIDTGQLVIMGHSVGGHLALTTGMIPLSTSGLGSPCVTDDMSGPPPGSTRNSVASVKPAAIINWFGITDVMDVTEGPNRQGYAIRWLGTQPDRTALAKSVSPLSYVRTDLPPIITIHGDKDPLVPYAHAVRLHHALTAAKVPNQLITIHGAGHGRFGVTATRDVYTQVFEFLEKAGVAVWPDAAVSSAIPP